MANVPQLVKGGRIICQIEVLLHFNPHRSHARCVFSHLLYHGCWTIKLISNLLDVKLIICHFFQNILYLQASQFYTADTRRIFTAEERKGFTSVWRKHCQSWSTWSTINPSHWRMEFLSFPESCRKLADCHSSLSP